jgi:uncharacterized membrane protein
VKVSPRQISIAGLVAALYFVITITPGISAISYGPLQVRIAEALTVLPFIFPGAVVGLFAGCLLANIFGPVGIEDVIFGSLLTFWAAWGTWMLRRFNRPLLAPLPPILINGLGVPIYLHVFFDQPYWAVVGYITLGEFIACYLLGYPLLRILLRKRHFG